MAYFQVLRERSDKKTASDKIRKAEEPKRPKEIYLDGKNVDNIRISPDEKHITFRTSKSANPKSTIIPNYVTESGFTEDINARTKVGAPLTEFQFFVYDIVKDTVLEVKTNEIPGIFDKPDYVADYPEKKPVDDKKEKSQSRAK